MSIRVYRLLRNNKEEGPFTSEELIQQNLRPYDLIWIDGRSTAWSYPGELPDFKKYTPLPTENQATISASIQAAIAINDLAEPTLKQKPRFRISAAWNKIQTVTSPSNKLVPAEEHQKKVYPKMVETHQPQGFQSKSLSWEEAWQDWEKEKKITPATDTSKTKAAPVKKRGKNASPVVEIKYSEPLDSLKDKYIDNIIAQKQNTSAGTKAFVLPTISLIIIFSAGYWLLHNTNMTTVLATPPAKTVQPVKTADIPPVVDAGNKKENTNPAEEVVAPNYAAERKPIVTQSSNTSGNKHVQPTTPQKSFSKPKPEPVAAKQTVPLNKPVQEKPDTNYIAKTNTNNTGIDKKPAETENNPTEESHAEDKPILPVITHPKSTTDYVLVPQRIDLNDGSASLKIQNISDITLDLVVINVQYFGVAHIYRKGETLYLHNLKAGKNITIKTPKDTSAFYATAKVSLVSADAENISVIGDN